MEVVTVTSYSGRLESHLQGMYGWLPYHRWSHAQAVRGMALKIAKRAIDAGILVDIDAVQVAALGHDAFFAADHTVFRMDDGELFRHREHFAAYTVARAASRFGAGDDFCDRIFWAMMGTNANEPLMTPEAMIVAAADLSSIASDRWIFDDDWNKLMKESIVLSGAPLEQRAFVRGVVGVLSVYLGRDIRLSPHYFDENGASEFHVRAMGNILHHVRDSWDKDLQVVGQFGCGKVPWPIHCPEIVDADTVFVGICERRDVRGARTLLTANLAANGHPVPMTVILPAEKSAVSLPDGALHHMLMVDQVAETLGQFPMNQIARVITKGGRFLVIESGERELQARLSLTETIDRFSRACVEAGFGNIEVTVGESGVFDSWEMTLERC